MRLNDLERRIIDISYKHRLSHISSCLITINPLYDILVRNRGPVILGNGHAGLALYVALENLGICDSEEMLLRHGIHPVRDVLNGVVCSSGSLGQAETIAVGMALAHPETTVSLMTSDGACMEGSVYEAARFASMYLDNLDIHIIANGYGAYGGISSALLPKNASIISVDMWRFPAWLHGLGGHYVVMDEAKYKELIA
jgi:transketolase N-terminal domain/subunit